jgi:dTDP-4-dehydrorhamnose reductase
MKIFVFGSNGMLGRYVSTYLKNQYTVVDITRNEIDASNIRQEELQAKLFHLGLKEGDVVVNCVGTIKPMVDSLGDLNAIQVNSVFPRILANVCQNMGVKMVHPTTDCVYSGLKGSYNEDDKYDVSDVYGMSKAMGEPSNCTVVRTSIIGEEVGQGRSLVEWIKSNNGGKINGYLNHHWNGVTCLQFAKIVKTMIANDLFWFGIKHLHSNTLNKYELSSSINNHFNLGIEVTPMSVGNDVDRSLSTIYKDNLEKFDIPSLDEQIKDMYEFHSELYNIKNVTV